MKGHNRNFPFPLPASALHEILGKESFCSNRRLFSVATYFTSSGDGMEAKGWCLFSLFQKAPLLAQNVLAACGNFGMPFALSLL
jgi:hypothetical protein